MRSRTRRRQRRSKVLIETRPATGVDLVGLGALFTADRSAAGCWCMWFIIPVRDYHAAGGEGNRARFEKLVAASRRPVGVVAYEGGEPVGWCAAGPRSRYARAIRTPTYAGRDPAEDDAVWLVPCLFVRSDRRGGGVGAALLAAAVEIARSNGAAAVEAFPLTSGKRHSRDLQVGFERAFAEAGFRPLRRPSAARVLMRRDLAATA